MTRRYYVHVAIGQAVGHLLSIQTPLPLNPEGEASEAVQGVAHSQIADEAEWLSWMADVDHSDADGLLMAQQMQQRDDFWMEVSREDYDRLTALGSVAGSVPTPTMGYRTHHVYGECVAILDAVRGESIDISPALAGKSLDPIARSG